MNILRRWLLFIALFLSLPLSSDAAPLSPQDVPEPLQPWISWVLQGHEQQRCPFLYNAGDTRQCSWPSRLELQLGARGGTFAQQWLVLSDGWVPLPGNSTLWPQGVELDGQATVVGERNGVPHVYVRTGSHTLSGAFIWDRLPEALPIPKETGLISVAINDRRVDFPDLDTEGRLWLQRRTGTEGEGKESTEDRLALRIYRRIIDDIPLLLTTRIELDVSGRQREVLLGPTMPEGYLPLSLESSLPARLESDGRLRVQVRPGHWSITFTVRHPGLVNAIPLVSASGPWPDEEVWVFEARNDLRLVTIEGVPAIDPQQTTLPEEWRHFPAYRVQPGDTFQIVEKRRGDPDPAPDQLALERNLWLDFRGSGYTIQDHISGTMTRGWRLEMNPPATLGRVNVDGQDQFITRLGESERAGVEVRRGHIQLTAVSRLDGFLSPVPAVSWEQDFQQVSGVLHLPPGWRVFSASGVDDIADTWFQQWTLLDIFLVLFIALAIARLWGRPWGILALFTLVLMYHEPDAPRIVWLHVLIAVALLRVLPVGRARRAVQLYRALGLLSLIAISVPFMVQQVRQGLHPQLEKPWQMVGERHPQTTALPEERVFQPSPRVMLEGATADAPPREARAPRAEPGVSSTLTQYDPTANIQTGPGLPQWQWHSVALRWNGPVERSQQVSLVLLSPRVNMLLAFLRVILLAALLLCVLNIRYTPGAGFTLLPSIAVASLVAVLVVGLGFISAFSEAHAEIPSPALLNELRSRLLAEPDCLPQCASSPRLRLEIKDRTLLGRFEVHTSALVAVPLPGLAQQWLPQTILLDGNPAPGLFRDRAGIIWIELAPGRHQVLLQGLLPDRDTVQLPLPLKPHRVEVDAEGWTIEGLSENDVADDYLQLRRVQQERQEAKPAALETSVFPPFVRVERTLLLGLTWQVETEVVRVSPPDAAVVLEIPLLAGESVTSAHVRVEGDRVLLTLAPQDSTARWSSVFEKRDQVTLTAPETTTWTEVWRLEVSPIWHLETTGIPVVHHQTQTGRRLPEWRPWPGESLTFTVTRPEGIPGQTLTVDSSQLVITPGQRAIDARLDLHLRSSQGGQHQVILPEQAQLQSVSINGQTQPIRQEGRTVTLPLVPAAQHVEILWQQAEGITRWLRTPIVDVALENVNARVQIDLPRDRWILFTGGPRIGPAVLFWAVLLVVVLVAVGLGRLHLTPLKTHQWILLGIGLTPAPLGIGIALIVTGWLLALGWRRRLSADMRGRVFDAIQVGLGFLTVAALAALFYAITQDLLGHPDMQIVGNGSSSEVLRWYQDRSGKVLPQAWVFSVPLTVYRLAMLAWSLWLAFALLNWLRWGWECFSENGIWRPLRGSKPSGSE